jgi:hypothetical protein
VKPFHWLFVAILITLAAFTGYWFWALEQAKQAFTDYVRTEQSRGVAIEFSAISWGGFPVRLGAQITGLKYAAGIVELEAGNVRFEVMPWNPTDGLLRVEGNVRLAIREDGRAERIELRPEIIIARLNVSNAGMLESVAVELRSSKASGTTWRGAPFQFDARRLQIDLRPGVGSTPGRETYEMAFSADVVRLGEGITPLLGETIKQIRMAVRLTDMPPFAQGFRPVDRADFISVLAATGTEAEIARLDVDWGTVSAKATGRLRLDSEKRPSGRMDVNVVNLRVLVDALRNVYAIEDPAQDFPEPPGGTPVPLVLNDGAVTFGPLTVGTIEPLR